MLALSAYSCCGKLSVTAFGRIKPTLPEWKNRLSKQAHPSTFRNLQPLLPAAGGGGSSAVASASRRVCSPSQDGASGRRTTRYIPAVYSPCQRGFVFVWKKSNTTRGSGHTPLGSGPTARFRPATSSGFAAATLRSISIKPPTIGTGPSLFCRKPAPLPERQVRARRSLRCSVAMMSAVLNCERQEFQRPARRECGLGAECRARGGGAAMGARSRPEREKPPACSQARISRAVAGAGLSFASARADTPSRGQV